MIMWAELLLLILIDIITAWLLIHQATAAKFFNISAEEDRFYLLFPLFPVFKHVYIRNNPTHKVINLTGDASLVGRY